MTTYEMPPYLIGAHSVDVVRMDLSSPESSGRTGGVQMGWPKWRGVYEAVAQSDYDAQLWSVWFRRQRGAINLIKATDPARWYPYKYRPRDGFAGGFPGGWNGDASGFSLSGDRSQVTLTIPSGIEVTMGDLLGFRWASGAKHVMTEFMEGGTSNGSLTLNVEPAVHSVVPNDAIAYLLKPAFLARLTSESEAPGFAPGGGTSGKIVCMQEIVP